MMEARSDMKKLFVLSSLIAAMIVAGCQKEKEEIFIDEAERTHKVVVNASVGTQSKTSISATADGYKVSWDVGDAISLYESAPATEKYVWNAVRCYESSELDESDIIDGIASFSFEIEDRTAPDAMYTYISGRGGVLEGIHQEYDSEDDPEYIEWCDKFEYSGEYVPPHMILRAQIYPHQCPESDTFDSGSDLLISDVKVMSEQLDGEIAFSFARIGTIVKITLSGLDDYVGKRIRSVDMSAGESMKLTGEIRFDTVLGQYVYNQQVSEELGGDFMNGVRLEPDELFVKEDGTADLWLRTFSGEMTDWFRLDMEIEGDDELSLLSRYVDLASAGKSILFPEGKIARFSVGGWLVMDVEDPYVSYKVNEGMDGFTATWEEVAHAVGYECVLVNSSDVETVLTPVDNNDGTWTVAVAGGLAPDAYTLFVTPVPEPGHALVSEDGGYAYMHIGVPIYWMLAHDAFNYWRSSTDCEPIGDGEYIISRYSLDKVRFKNLEPEYQASWQALVSTGEWFMYNTEPFKKIHSIEVWSKDDSYKEINVYASSTAGAESVKLDGVVVEESVIDTELYSHTHKKVRYTFPAEGIYQYYTIKGTYVGTIMTSQYSYIYYYE